MTKKHRRDAKAKRSLSAPIVRYLRISKTSGSKADIIEVLGGLTLGSEVVPRYTEQFSHGLRGDMEALGFDYGRVLGKVKANSLKGIAAE